VKHNVIVVVNVAKNAGTQSNMKTPIATLVKRIKYKGGRKYRRAFFKLGKFRMSEISAAGFEIVLRFPKQMILLPPAPPSTTEVV